MKSLRVFRRQLVQAGAIVAVVPNDSSVGTAEFKDFGIQESKIRSGQWFGEVQQTDPWVNYFSVQDVGL